MNLFLKILYYYFLVLNLDLRYRKYLILYRVSSLSISFVIFRVEMGLKLRFGER